MNGLSVVIPEPGDLRLVPTEAQAPGPGEALVKVAHSGICGSDRDVYTGTRPSGFVRYPVTPGHEWSGTVEAVGDDVDPALVGKPVVGEGFRNCQVCPACRRGDANLCAADYDETGFTRPGAWSSFLTLPARLLHVLPDGADLRAAAVLEPAACAAAACLKLAVSPGERVAVIGGGSLGLLSAQLLAASSPAELTLVHSRPGREELAAACGATSYVTSPQAEELTGRFDAVIEAAGASGCADLATRLVRRGGRVALTGIPERDEQPLSSAHLVLSEVTVHTVFGASPRAWNHAVRAFAAGVLQPEKLISRQFSITEAAEALRVLSTERDDVVKILLGP
ncbi:zinc-dependent alcohol dehydrogenase [Saccharopolyspora mangrovi]|uniref:Alcohol dehydrogenase catalytic domain-containing protein n=1 Tax=Saccharopolyspora mangrovi TaxID=3082379 RepID=A0ABU6ABQ6_9PSEU|nr:alcohol dehydrogenase catalytic domain-containing protein [Saccharopolyspora sp. S2-29]MEB3368923.1 alcohol dehydrogenase catalytic domain-containing protein [Saccharopolyspora sp. S2-29]